MRARNVIGIVATCVPFSIFAGVYQTQSQTDQAVKKEAANTPVKLSKDVAEKPAKQEPKASPTPKDGKK
ncbi:hypothetical protein [Variovorax sp. V118]|uniref:hypothetical protein n=1 Tax=Variovorax sp. V118 TaxID=3065954 RepID=UPI0034E8E357